MQFPPGPQLQTLRADHGPAVLALELANRTYFAASISDRGDDYFEHFGDRYGQIPAEQETGRVAYFVLVSATAPSPAGSTCPPLGTGPLRSGAG